MPALLRWYYQYVYGDWFDHVNRLIAKHGILITQFANTELEKGKSVYDAVIAGSTVRLRPILMTTAAMVMGALPLMLSSGAGANSRHQIGLVIVSGMLGGTLFSLFIVPSAYMAINQLKIRLFKRVVESDS